MAFLHVGHQGHGLSVAVHLLNDLEHLRGDRYQSGIRPLSRYGSALAEAVGHDWDAVVALIAPN